MKDYQICVESYLSNNSDYKEYDNYYYKTKNWDSAVEYAKKVINNWNKNSKSVIYNIFDITPCN